MPKYLSVTHSLFLIRPRQWILHALGRAFKMCQKKIHLIFWWKLFILWLCNFCIICKKKNKRIWKGKNSYHLDWLEEMKFSSENTRFNECCRIKHWFYCIAVNLKKKQLSLKPILAFDGFSSTIKSFSALAWWPFLAGLIQNKLFLLPFAHNLAALVQ